MITLFIIMNIILGAMATVGLKKALKLKDYFAACVCASWMLFNILALVGLIGIYWR